MKPLGRRNPDKCSPMMWECQCECGNLHRTSGSHLRSGRTDCCQKCQRQKIAKASTTHGCGAKKSRTPEYNSWRAITDRCFNKNCHKFPNYGAKGIIACDGIKNSFPHFLETVGKKPSPKMTIDRIDNTKGYDCGICIDCVCRGADKNCHWATPKQQAQNTSVNVMLEFRGETLCKAEMARRYNITPQDLQYRLKMGWTTEEALLTPRFHPKIKSPVLS